MGHRGVPGRGARGLAPGEAECSPGAHRCTWDSGPALTGNCAVFTTWMPAFCSPLNGVTIGEVAPGSPSHPQHLLLKGWTTIKPGDLSQIDVVAAGHGTQVSIPV